MNCEGEGARTRAKVFRLVRLFQFRIVQANQYASYSIFDKFFFKKFS